MADARDVVASIQEMLLSTGQVAAAELSDVADQYARLCRQANQRLKRCKLYLDQGLVGEAIADVETAPDLLELVERLCFAERPDWEALCEANGLTAPAIQEEIASELNEAYSDLDPVKDLLRTQRVRVLQHAGMAVRARVVQQLVRAAPRSIWGEYLSDHLRLATAELVAESEAAGRELERIEQITARMQELGIQPHVGQFQQVEAKRLEAVGHELVESHRQGDLSRARELSDSYRELVESGRAESEEAGVLEALEWVAAHDAQDAQEERFRQVCLELQAELADQPEREALERLAGRIESMGRELPEPLHSDYIAALQAIRRGEQRRLLSRAGLVAAAVLAVAVLSAVGLRRYRAGKATEQWVKTIDGALEVKQFERARLLLEELSSKHPALARRAEIQQVEQRYKKRATADRARVARLDAALAAAREALAGDEIVPAHKQLSSAARLASRETERAEVEQLGRRIREAGSKKTDRIERELRELRITLSSLLGPQVVSPVELSKLQAVGTRLARLLDDKELADEARARAMSLAERTRRRIDRIEKGLARDKAARGDLAMIARAGKDPDLLASRLESFVRRYPGHPTTDQFQRALRQAPQWRAIAAWNAIATAKPEDPPASLVGLTGYLKQNAQAYNHAFVTEYLAWCQARAFTINQLSGNQQGLGAMLDHWLLKLQYVETKRGTRYYFRLARQLHPLTAGAEVLQYRLTYQTSTLDPNKTDSVMLSPDELAWVEARAAPGSRFRAKAQVLLNLLRSDPSKQERWELVYRDLAQLVLAEKQMHPVLQVTLLARIAQLATLHSSGLASHYRKIHLQLKDVDTEGNWLAPSGKTDRDSLRSNLVGLDTLLDMLDRQRLDRARASIFGKPARQAYDRQRPVGVLLPTDGGVRVVPAPRRGVMLYALVPVAGSWALRRIGTAGDGGRIVPLDRTPPDLPHGTQLFVQEANR